MTPQVCTRAASLMVVIIVGNAAAGSDLRGIGAQQSWLKSAGVWARVQADVYLITIGPYPQLNGTQN